jgi:hypothetical protein
MKVIVLVIESWKEVEEHVDDTRDDDTRCRSCGTNIRVLTN